MMYLGSRKFQYPVLFSVLCVLSYFYCLDIYAKGTESSEVLKDISNILTERPGIQKKERKSKGTLKRKIFSPHRTQKNEILSLSPHSELSDSIYLIHDLDPEKLPHNEKIDFEYRVVSFKELQAISESWINWIAKAKIDGQLHTFHRYIGMVSIKTKMDRTAFHRMSEHAIACNSREKQAEKRLCLGLKDASHDNRKVQMTVLAHRINPQQIEAIEAYFIKLFDCLRDLGWNSNSGNIDAYNTFIGNTRSAVKILKFPDPESEEDQYFIR